MRIFIYILIIVSSCKNLYCYSLFDTSFYDVEFVSNNIEDRKITKIREIKTKSLIRIFKKTISDEKLNEIQKLLSEDLINTFVKNIVIDDEIIIDNKYVSKIKVNFEKKNIIKFYRDKKIPYVEYHPNKFLLILYEENIINDNLFSKNNNYYSYLINNLQNSSKLKIPNHDINDRYILKKEHIKNRDINKIKLFSKKYNLDEIIIVIAKNNNNNVFYDLILISDNNIIEKRLKYKENQLDKFFNVLEIETLSMWKKANFIQNKNLNFLNCNINYFNNLELKEIRKKMNNISIIQNLDIKSLSYKKIEYNIQFFGNFKILKNLLNLNKLKINDPNFNCVIKLK